MSQNPTAQAVRAAFQQHFATPSRLVRSPGRVNLIGEHTDYNQGWVLPGAIDKAIYAGLSPRTDGMVHAYSIDYQQEHQFSLDALTKDSPAWSHYLMGVTDQLRRGGYAAGGFNCVIGGEVPVGAGLSSSAALSCALLFGLNELYALGIPRLRLAQLAQGVENDFVGVKVGIMDMFASLFGKADHVLRLDCRSLEHTYFPLPTRDLQIVLCDSMVKHALVTSEYNLRRQQCEAGVAVVQQTHPDVRALRDVTPAMLAASQAAMPAVVYDRCRYVTEENQRVLDATQDLTQGDMAAFGRKMYLTHAGLRDLYAVSCPELDWLVDFASRQTGVLGARMMGGGFGGCTINLVEKPAVADFVARAESNFEAAFGKRTAVYVVTLQNGTELVAD